MAAANKASGATAAMSQRRLPFFPPCAGAGLAAELRTMAASSCETAESDGNRSGGFFAIIFKQTASIRGSRPGHSSRGGVGAWETIWPITDASDPRKGTRPVNNSYKITPRLYWSAAGPIFSGSASTCSGGM